MPFRVFLLLVLTAILWGGTPIVEKTALKATAPLPGLLVRNVFVALLLILAVTFMGKWQEVINISNRNKVFFCLTGLMAGLLGMYTYFTALKMSPVTKAVPIAAAYPLVAAVLGIIFLGEKITFLRILGTVLIILGVWLVK
jgi:transporter family protein